MADVAVLSSEHVQHVPPVDDSTRSFLVILSGRVVQFVLILLLLRVASTLLDPREVGRVSLAQASTTFFALSVINPVGMFLNRRLHVWRRRGIVKQRLKVYWLFLLSVAVLGSLAMIPGRNSLLKDLDMSPAWLIVLIGGSLLFNTANQTYIPSLNLFGYRLSFIVLTVATLACSLIAAVCSVRDFHPTAEFWLGGILAGQLLVGFIGMAFFHRRLYFTNASISGNVSSRQLQRLVLFVLPLSLSVGFNWAQFQGYRFLVGRLIGIESLGYFVAGFGVGAGIVAALEQVLTTHFQPLFYERVSRDSDDDYVQAWKAYLRALLPATVITVGFVCSSSVAITRIILAPKFQTAVLFVAWGAVVDSSRVITNAYAMLAHARMRTSSLLFPNAVGAVVALCSVILLTQRFGLSGVGPGLAVGGFAAIVTSHLVLCRGIEAVLPWQPMMFAAIAAGALVVFNRVLQHIVFGDKTGPMALRIMMCAFAYGTVQFLLLEPTLRCQRAKH